VSIYLFWIRTKMTKEEINSKGESSVKWVANQTSGFESRLIQYQLPKFMPGFLNPILANSWKENIIEKIIFRRCVKKLVMKCEKSFVKMLLQLCRLTICKQQLTIKSDSVPLPSLDLITKLSYLTVLYNVVLLN